MSYMSYSSCSLVLLSVARVRVSVPPGFEISVVPRLQIVGDRLYYTTKN